MPSTPRIITADATERLDTLLPRMLGGSRSSWQQRIAAGLVTIHGKAPTKHHKTAMGEEITIEEPPQAMAAPAVPTVFPCPVLYSGQGCIIINKPAGMLSHGAPSAPGEHGVEELALAAGLTTGDSSGHGGLAHRLDRDTTGVLLLGATRAAQAWYSEQWAARTVAKDYLALVAGVPQTAAGRIEGAIGRGEQGGMALGGRAARDAASSFALVGTGNMGGQVASLLLVRLHTGRTHQIRVHLQAIGLALLGDALYANKAATGLAERTGLTRQALHAWRLQLPGMGGTPIAVQAGLPADMQQALRQLGIAADVAQLAAAEALLPAMNNSDT